MNNEWTAFTKKKERKKKRFLEPKPVQLKRNKEKDTDRTAREITTIKLFCL